MASIARPNVEVIQVFEAASPTVLVPTLRPCVIGPAFEVVEVYDDDGAINANARDGAYDQFQQTVDQTSFPDPRSNLDELDIQESSIRTFLSSGGELTELDNGDSTYGDFGSAHLRTANWAFRPALVTDVGAPFTFSAGGDPLVLAIDQVLRTDTTSDVTVTLSGTMTAALVAAAINTAVGSTVAAAVGTRVVISSTNYGASASVTVRAGSAASAVLFNTLSGATVEYRVTGAGFRGEDDGDADTRAPWVEYNQGEYLEDGVGLPGVTWPGVGAIAAGAGLYDEAALLRQDQSTARTFTGANPDVPLQAANTSRPGDLFYADGVRVGAAEVISVQTSRFRLGTLDTANTTYDDDGNPLTRVYIPVEVGTILDASPLAPRNAWFHAEGLVEGNIIPLPQAATLTGAVEGAAALNGRALSRGVDWTTGMALTGYFLRARATVDGVQGDEQEVALGNYANLAALVTALNAATGFTDITATGVDLGAITNGTLVFTAVAVADIQGASVTLDLRPVGGSLHTIVEGVDWIGDPTTPTTMMADFCIYLATLTGVVTATPVGPVVTLTLRDGYNGNSVPMTVPTNWTLNGNVAGPWPLTLHVGENVGAGTAVAADGGGFLILSSDATGDDEAVEVMSTGSLNAQTLVGLDGNFGSGIGRDVEFGDPAQLNDAAIGACGLVGGEIIDLFVTDRNGTWRIYYTIAAGDIVPLTWTGLATALNAGGANGQADGAPGFELVEFYGDDTVAAEAFGVRTLEASGTTCVITTGPDLDAAFTWAATDPGSAGVAGSPFGFELDENPHDWIITCTNESLDDIIDQINTEIGGHVVASAGGTNSRQLVLTSMLLGTASFVNVFNTGVYIPAVTVLGFLAANDDRGAGRPNPDFYLDSSNSVVVGAQILRDPVTGIPTDQDNIGASYIYLQFTALRLDVSPAAAIPGLLSLDDTDEIESLGSPISTDNPLFLAAYFAKLNAPGISVTAIGVDEVSAAMPEGTLSGYSSALNFLQTQEVYALCPLSQQPTVHQLCQTHVDLMSQPTMRGERIVFINPEVPTEGNATIVLSGTDGNTTGTTNQFVCDTNPAAALLAAGVNPAVPIPVSSRLYLEVTVGGVLMRYNVSAVSGALLTLNQTFAAGENDDAFYAATALTATLTSVPWSLEIRGAALTVAGVTNLEAVVDAVAGAATAYGDRRVYSLFPDTVEATLDEGDVAIPAYYFGAATCGMVGQLLPQQGFTNYPVAGFTGVQGSNDTFTETQLNEIAGGGVYIIIQDVDGAPLISRHQLSTLVTTIETRELSITKCVDYVAKTMRAAVRNYIGIYNITPQFLDTLTTVVEGVLDFLYGAGVVTGKTLNSIIQDTANPDTIEIDVTLDVPYPCNYIRIQLRV